MERNNLIKGLLQKAESDIKTARDLFKTKHYDWCLFIWHLALEKKLKAKILSLEKTIIYTHDLVRLAKHSLVLFSEEDMKHFYEITTFNIEARYDDYKLSFYHKATSEYTKLWFVRCESLFNKIIISK